MLKRPKNLMVDREAGNPVWTGTVGLFFLCFLLTPSTAENDVHLVSFFSLISSSYFLCLFLYQAFQQVNVGLLADSQVHSG